MAAPTQELPPWLSYSTTTITGANGSPVSTSTTLINLPLTYYGPSIPLGTNGVWTFGGSTSPASTPTATTATSTATPSTITVTVTPSSLSLSTSATPSSTSFISSSSSIPSVSTATATVTSTPATSSSTHRNNLLLGAILGSILGALLLFLVLLLAARWYARRRSFATPIWTGWEIVEPEAEPEAGDDSAPASPREPGEGSPRGSGEEADSFLQRSRSAGMTQAGGATARLVSASPAAMAGADDPDNDVSSEGSGYGSVIEPGTAFRADASDRASADTRRGHILPPGDLLRVEAEHIPRYDPITNLSPLLPPPPLDPDRRRGVLSLHQKDSHSTTRSRSPVSLSDAEEGEGENATFLTARRVRVQDLGPRPHDDEAEADPGPSSSSWRSSLGAGLGSLARFGRLSWFKNIDNQSSSRPASGTHSRSRERSRPVSLIRQGLSDPEIEAGRALLSHSHDPDMTLKPPSRLALGFNAQGERPMSSVSAKSAVSSGGNTVYHSLPGTPVLTPLPRAMTPQNQGHGGGQGPSGAPPAYDDDVGSPTYTPGGHDDNVDILDTPAPPPISPFTTASSTTSRGATPFPPGLGLAPIPTLNPRSWQESMSEFGSSSGRDGGTSPGGAGVTIDVLEEEPPAAGEGWRSLAGGAIGGAIGGGERRTTFGLPQLVHPHSPTYSEQGSLHSMRSHLSPRSARTSGSAAVSSRHNLSTSMGSGSSRPSAHSQARSGSSAASLARSGSISSDGRWRTRSPNANVGRASVSAMGYPSPTPHVPVGNNLRSPLSGALSSTGTTTTDTETTHTTATDTTVAPEVMHFPNVPWATTGDTRAEVLSDDGSRWWAPPTQLPMRATSDQDSV